MSEKRELARREALEAWLAAVRWVGGEGEMLREAELAFEKWWTSTSRRQRDGRSTKRG